MTFSYATRIMHNTRILMLKMFYTNSH